MKFDMGETHDERAVRLDLWHRSFAIFPVQVGSHDWRWLEVIWRRYDPWTGWQYVAGDAPLEFLCRLDAERIVNRRCARINGPVVQSDVDAQFELRIREHGGLKK